MADALICGVWAPHEPSHSRRNNAAVQDKTLMQKSARRGNGLKQKTDFSVLKWNLNANEKLICS